MKIRYGRVLEIMKNRKEYEIKVLTETFEYITFGRTEQDGLYIKGANFETTEQLEQEIENLVENGVAYTLTK